MSKSTLTSVVDRLVQLNLVRREASFEDGRNQLIHIEPEGRALIEQSAVHTRRVNAALLSNFSTSEIDTIERFLTHVSENGERIVFQVSQPHSTDPMETTND